MVIVQNKLQTTMYYTGYTINIFHVTSLILRHYYTDEYEMLKDEMAGIIVKPLIICSFIQFIRIIQAFVKPETHQVRRPAIIQRLKLIQIMIVMIQVLISLYLNVFFKLVHPAYTKILFYFYFIYVLVRLYVCIYMLAKQTSFCILNHLSFVSNVSV